MALFRLTREMKIYCREIGSSYNSHTSRGPGALEDASDTRPSPRGSQHSRGMRVVGLEDVSIPRLNPRGAGGIQRFRSMGVAREQTSREAPVSGVVEIAKAPTPKLQEHRDCERKLSLVLNEKNKLQKQLSEICMEIEYPGTQASFLRDENMKLQMDLTDLQDELHSVKVELREERDRTLCILCLDRPRDTVIFSCLHFHFCSPCVQKHLEQSSTCPSCRGFISGKLTCNI